jgi:hypothetical protein
MVDSQMYSWLLQGIDRTYHGQWKGNSFFTEIETGGVGIIVIHDLEAGVLAVGARVLTGVTFSEALVRELGKLNSSLVLGSFVLKEGEKGHWSIAYGLKVRCDWLEPNSRTSSHMVLDILNAPPHFIERGVEALQPKFGGERPSIAPGWSLTLMDSF